MNLKKIYGEISKVEELDDGTIKVWGWASSEAVDSDGEIITAEAMKAALPDYMKFGAVREMHQAKAAGTAIEAEVNDEGRTWFGAHVVDSEAVKKVINKVYKGFSIGGKVTERDNLDKSIIKGLRLVEVSLVDRPANPDAVFTIFKADSIEDAPPAIDELAALLNTGTITPERLLELVKAAEVSAEPEVIEKSMWDVSNFAQCLQSLSYLASDVEWESQSEGDNSPIPAALRTWLASGIEILKAMTAEEAQEMIDRLNANAQPVITDIAQADQTGDLHKAGARFSKATKEALKAVHDAMGACCEHLGKLGYMDDAEEEPEKGVSAEDLQKAEDIHKAEISKLTDDLAKAAERIKELEAQPAPGKILLRAVSKGDDIIKTDEAETAPVKNPDGAINDTASLIKSMHKQGGQRLFG